MDVYKLVFLPEPIPTEEQLPSEHNEMIQYSTQCIEKLLNSPNPQCLIGGFSLKVETKSSPSKQDFGWNLNLNCPSPNRCADFIVYLQRERDSSKIPVLIGQVVSDGNIRHSFDELVYYQLRYARPCEQIGTEHRLLGVVVDFNEESFVCVTQEILVSNWFSESVFRGKRKRLVIPTTNRIDASPYYKAFFKSVTYELQRGLYDYDSSHRLDTLFSKQSPTISSGYSV